MELASKYDPQSVESKWYEYWLDNKLFSSKPDGREPYTVVIPPPNVTGVLHMGHMLNNTIQDILVRRARMEGKNACWVPGTDHASIATEAKVVNKLAQEGIKKTDLTRDEFLKHAWAWTEEHGGIILKQLRKLGASCDWDRTAFTMDETRSKSVIKVFCDLYNKGLIYRGARMVNWDPQAQTALSDEEVVYKDEHSKLYYLKYRVVESDVERKSEGNVMHKDEKGYYAVVATTRPETIMGDTAMCINPDDEKNTWLKGKHVIVPLVGREIPVVEDGYVDIEFGTGCLKVTPAHDINDHALGLKHNLETIDIFNDNGTISEAAGMYVGMDRMDVRKQIEKDLKEAGLMEKVEDYNNKVGFSERTNVPIEPKLSTQWFLSMQHFADEALPPVMDDEIMFYPSKYKNTYRHWLENIKDWCISRQLWWGHRIPAYYYTTEEGKKDVVVAETAELALEEARKKNANLSAGDLEQDSDCLDTWFSSWLWPISLFNGILDPDNEEMKYYYPTSDLVTGPDIIFFWVARMIMAGYEYKGKMPFKHVYFTGIVRDKLGRKMSKSLGNSPDPLVLIDKYGADGVRMGMMLSAPAGNDILFDESLCEQGRNFNNKIWNAFRLVEGWEVADGTQPEANKIAVEWFNAKLRQANAEIDDLFKKYRISEALMTVYKLFWDEFSSWYLEMVKPAYGQPINKTTYEATLKFFENLLKMLHPFMPFITEELWQHIYERKDGESIMRDKLEISAPTGEDMKLIEDIESVKQIVAGVRTVRNQKNIANKETLSLQCVGENALKDYDSVVGKMANLTSIDVVTEKDCTAAAFMVGTLEYAVPLGDMIDVAAEIEKMEAQLKHLEGFLAGVSKKLSNERFVANAPEAVVALERKKQSDSMEKIAALKESISSLKAQK
ncbi:MULTISPECIES: valine--tRNA ligase [Prevotella]|jgi:valyl-tRNA synthetase|uniref:Valine--tRNA ligase n=2 Tax=Prevotella pectinovora TaxID=1602169 RepID=A0A0D0IZ07_9BACT|nr:MULTISPECIES: valine--tRNA ligase [Prevotella]KIP54855.1 valyl-tRNA synthetase [Prevotella pectinovora]KIP56698.1 valyl-tRNA synthetase [Prevotella pectinovora]KIP60753.1 valyl-tRNA synthetase [Prevotella pectinovora]KIP61896.1 valyl-tRNA synthetase [Prevotella pectinovora]MCI6048839.1 valine--tRNA ligase [Prevotella pectinovora]